MRAEYDRVIADLEGQAGSLIAVANQLRIARDAVWPAEPTDEHLAPARVTAALCDDRPVERPVSRPVPERAANRPVERVGGIRKDAKDGPPPPRSPRYAAADAERQRIVELMGNGEPWRPKDLAPQLGQTPKLVADKLARMAALGLVRKVDTGLFALPTWNGDGKAAVPVLPPQVRAKNGKSVAKPAQNIPEIFHKNIPPSANGADPSTFDLVAVLLSAGHELKPSDMFAAAAHAGLSTQQAKRRLRRAVDAGEIQCSGHARGARYSLPTTAKGSKPVKQTGTSLELDRLAHEVPLPTPELYGPAVRVHGHRIEAIDGHEYRCGRCKAQRDDVRAYAAMGECRG